MKSFNLNQLFEHHCITNKVYGVYIAGEQFDFEEDDAPRWDEFVQCVESAFPEQDHQALILTSIITGRFIVMDSEEDALKLFRIMGGSMFYSWVYAILFGPDGFISENT